MWFQGRERNKNSCPGGEALGGIVVQFCPDEELSDGTRDRTLIRHTVEELFGIRISFVQTMNLEQFYFTDPQIVHLLPDGIRYQ